MAKLLGLVGFSGTGKSTSLRNLPSKETFIVSPFKEELPIPGFSRKYKKIDKKGLNGNFYLTQKLSKMASIVEKVATHEHYNHIKYLVIEDNTHFFNGITLSNKFRDAGKGKENWSRWGDLGADIFQALFGNIGFRDDLWIITMFHPVSTMTPDGEVLSIKTPGSLLDREVDIPSYYVNMLYTKVVAVDRSDPQPPSERYKLVTNTDGYNPAKTVIGAFDELYIPNDLKVVLDRLDELRAEENEIEEETPVTEEGVKSFKTEK